MTTNETALQDALEQIIGLLRATDELQANGFADDAVNIARGLLSSLLQSPSQPVVAEAHSSLELCVQFSDDGQHIRKWSRLPFDGGECLYSHPQASPPPVKS